MPLGTKRFPWRARRDRRIASELERKPGSTATIAESGLSLEELARLGPSPRTGIPQMPSSGSVPSQPGGTATGRVPATVFAPASPPATPQSVPTPQTRQMPSLGLVRGPEAQRRSSGEGKYPAQELAPVEAYIPPGREADPYEGKSEATVILEMVLDGMERHLEAIVPTLGIPFGMRETTETRWAAWFKNGGTTEQQRREQMAALGLPEVLRRVYGEQASPLAPSTGG